jgi:hypothetical protein
VDLNELLYAHQLAVMNANTAHVSLEGREDHLEEASTYADKIRLMPGSLEVSQPADRPDAASPPNNPAVLSAWESEGGAIASP